MKKPATWIYTENIALHNSKHMVLNYVEKMFQLYDKLVCKQNVPPYYI